jgi:desulfoferrodoxin-like iron-binding protein
MTNVDEVYFCNICCKKVNVVEEGVEVLICCGKPMNIINWSDAWMFRGDDEKTDPLWH